MELFLSLKNSSPLVIGGGKKVGVVRNEGLQPARVLKLDEAMDRRQLQPMLDVEFEVEGVCDVARLVAEAGDEFNILLWQPARVVPGYSHLDITPHTGRHCDSLRCEGIVVV